MKKQTILLLGFPLVLLTLLILVGLLLPWGKTEAFRTVAIVVILASAAWYIFQAIRLKQMAQSTRKEGSKKD